MEITVPLVVTIFVAWGLWKKVGVFEAFLSGAKEGLHTAYMIAPTLVGLITAVTMLRSSGAIEALTKAITPISDKLGFPPEIVPVALLRPISGSGSSALLISILEEFGPDSSPGRIVSVMAGSTETTFYAIALYYGSVGIKKSRHTLVAGLCADFTAVVVSVMTVRLLM